jgi:hypothetical protein
MPMFDYVMGGHKPRKRAGGSISCSERNHLPIISDRVNLICWHSASMGPPACWCASSRAEIRDASRKGAQSHMRGASRP